MNNILMYHSVGAQNNGEIGLGLYCLSVDKFREQMELVHTPQGQSPSGTVPSLTFDDGLLDNYTNAYPILKEFGLKAYFFILASKISTPGYMNWEQIRELSDVGMITGSHGMTHRILTELNDEELDYELKESKKILEQNLGRAIEYFSLPKGHYNQRVINKIKEAGYKAVFTSEPKDNDGFKIGRIPVKANWSIEYFIRVMKNGLSLKDRAEGLLKNSSKRILGIKNYDRIRAKVLKK